MPKSTSRGPGLRAHSRSSSATKLGANLQFTQPAPAVQPGGAPAQKNKKSTGHVEAHAHAARAAPPFHRANSAQRVHSREQIAKRLAPLHQQHPPPVHQPQQQQARADKKGFSIANPSEDGEDDDEWESSESGAATPNHDDSGSDTASEDGLDPALLNLQISAHPRAPHPHHLQQQQQQQLEREQQQRQYEIEQQRRQRELDHQQYLLQQQQQQQQLYQRQLYLQQQQVLQQEQQYKQQQHPHQPPQRQLQSDLPQTHDTGLIRVNTARPSDFEQALHPQCIKTPRPPSPPHRQQHQQNQPSAQQQRQQQPQTRRQRSQERQDQRPHSPPPPSQQPDMERRPQPSRRESDPVREFANGKDTSRTQRSPRSHKSRPPSTHSNTSRSEHLRPHPLFRGLSHGQINTSKPAPLAPLTVVPTNSNELPQISYSPQPDSATGRYFLSSSPTSLRTSSGSPGSVAELPHSASHPFPFPTSQHHDRRTSFSSARSVNTVPAHAGILASRDIAPWTHERTRTLSTMSTASSSAALSSLANIPTATRPPSPQSIAFFPPVNPHANVGAIHPLLPGPYLHNHLTVLTRRTPIRESFDRVIRAKNARQAA